MFLVKRPEQRADQKKDQKQGEDDPRAEENRLATVLDRAAGQEALHDQLVGAMGGDAEYRPADYPHPEIVGHAQRVSRLRRQSQPIQLSPRARVAVYPNALPLSAVPKAEEEEIVAFSGNLEYHPNVNAVRYFQSEVWPLLKAACPGLRWRLIGKNEEAARAMIGEDPQVEFTGPVADAIWELARARVVVVPLLAGSGTRIKILEAWAAGRCVVSTPIGAEGLPARDGENIRIVTGPRRMAEAVLELLGDAAQRERLGRAGRATYETGFCWSAAWKTLETPFDSLLSVSPMAAAI